MKNKKLSPAFIFNLGRVWQSAAVEDWAEAKQVCELIGETRSNNKGLKRLRKAVSKEDLEGVDESLNKILGW